MPDYRHMMLVFAVNFPDRCLSIVLLREDYPRRVGGGLRFANPPYELRPDGQITFF